MSTRRRIFTFAIDDDLAAGMKALKERDGVSESEQARRAIRAFLEQRDIVLSSTAIKPTRPKLRRR
jgi:Ribbon-helix-helix protein, copG family